MMPELAVFQRRHGEVVEHEHIDPRIRQQRSADAAVYMSRGEFTQEFGSEDRVLGACLATLNRPRVIEAGWFSQSGMW